MYFQLHDRLVIKVVKNLTIFKKPPGYGLSIYVFSGKAASPTKYMALLYQEGSQVREWTENHFPLLDRSLNGLPHPRHCGIQSPISTNVKQYCALHTAIKTIQWLSTPPSLWRPVSYIYQCKTILRIAYSH